jgi:hypothetical protein
MDFANFFGLIVAMMLLRELDGDGEKDPGLRDPKKRLIVWLAMMVILLVMFVRAVL